jgi:hypothetical protein
VRSTGEGEGTNRKYLTKALVVRILAFVCPSGRLDYACLNLDRFGIPPTINQ